MAVRKACYSMVHCDRRVWQGLLTSWKTMRQSEHSRNQVLGIILTGLPLMTYFFQPGPISLKVPQSEELHKLGNNPSECESMGRHLRFQSSKGVYEHI